MSTITETTMCKYMRVIDALRQDPCFDTEDAMQVDAWLAGDVPAEHISRTLRMAENRVSPTIIKDHRRNVCACSDVA